MIDFVPPVRNISSLSIIYAAEHPIGVTRVPGMDEYSLPANIHQTAWEPDGDRLFPRLELEMAIYPDWGIEIFSVMVA